MARVEVVSGALLRLEDEMTAKYHRERSPTILLLMQIETPVDTGALRLSGRVDPTLYRQGRDRIIRFRFDRNGDPAGVSVAQIIFAGRGEIRPVRARALRWVTKRGVVVFATRSRAVAPNRWPLRVFFRLGFRDARVAYR